MHIRMALDSPFRAEAIRHALAHQVWGVLVQQIPRRRLRLVAASPWPPPSLRIVRQEWPPARFVHRSRPSLPADEIEKSPKSNTKA